MKQIKYVTALILAGVMFNADCGGSENNLESDNSKWSQVSTDGGSFTTALQQDGTLWGWGFDEGSFFGLGENGPYQVWTPMKLSKDTDWIKVSGDYIIKANGTLWTWDRNRFYQLNYDTDWVDIIRGFNHTIALKKNGTLWAWGENGLGELGLGDNTDRFLFAQYRQVGCDTDWTRVAAGNRCTLAIKANGTMWGWGGIWGNKLKDSSGMKSNIPIQIGTESNWTKIACGINCFNAAIKKDGTLWTWGDNIKGQLGLGDTIDRIEPTQVGTDKDWLDVSAHGSMIALKSDGTLCMRSIRQSRAYQTQMRGSRSSPGLSRVYISYIT